MLCIIQDSPLSGSSIGPNSQVRVSFTFILPIADN